MNDDLARFEEIVSQDTFRLARAFLAFGRAEYPDLDVDHELGRLDALGAEAADTISASAPSERLVELSAFLSGSGFRGNREQYGDPRNSFLNEVLDRRTGIPISLSVVWMDCGAATGVPLAGVGMPMHFLVRLDGTDVYADPFNGGRILTSEDAMVLFAHLTEGRLEWQDAYLNPTSPRDIVRRALTNLKAAYGAMARADLMLWVVEHLLVIPGAPAAERRERATVLAALGKYRRAITDLETYLEDDPDDADEAEQEIRRLKSSMN